MIGTITKEMWSKLPKLYETEFKPLKEKDILWHLYINECHWYIVEGNYNKKLLWGFVILNKDYVNAEWGYISLTELREIKLKNGDEVVFDFDWTSKKAKDVPNIKRCLYSF